MTKFNIFGAAAVIGLLTTLGCSADAATVHHIRTRHHHLTSGFANSFAYEPDRAPVHFNTPSYTETPSYNDASKFGGSTALPAE
jgi:hypothetical protein